MDLVQDVFFALVVVNIALPSRGLEINPAVVGSHLAGLLHSDKELPAISRAPHNLAAAFSCMAERAALVFGKHQNSGAT
jgi:hypothetical protein